MHVRYPKRTPMKNLLLTMLDKANEPYSGKIGDSTGKLDLPMGHAVEGGEDLNPVG
jgi:hypothetical protein